MTRATSYLGPAAQKRLNINRLYLLSCFIDQLLYATQDIKDKSGVRTGSSIPDRVYIGADFPEYVKVNGREGNYLDALRGLREIEAELERLAAIEVTS